MVMVDTVLKYMYKTNDVEIIGMHTAEMGYKIVGRRLTKSMPRNIFTTLILTLTLLFIGF